MNRSSSVPTDLRQVFVDELAGRWYGVHTALVVDVKDPDGQGRVKVRLPWSPDAGGAAYEAWARLATLMGGGNRGTWFVPDPDDEVLVAFEAGDPRRPYVMGGLWNGVDTPPEVMDRGGSNDRKVIRSRSGVRVVLDDTRGEESFVVETPGGQRITLRDSAGGAVEVVDSSGDSVRMGVSGITVTSSRKVSVSAGSVEVSAATLKVNAGMSRFSGVVQADTFLASSVVSASYTPGAGNIW
ncbi:phage baseplate assembly protein V [Streptomyces sp. NPDC059916]|uniref:phage baseplate assembly protein V n=1 Tax=Streptomyces sp. NPDC059916 TaxID=3347001 RepID=UPI0036BD3ADF